MVNVTRYDPGDDRGCGPTMFSSKDGEFVEYEDYAKLLRKIEAADVLAKSVRDDANRRRYLSSVIGIPLAIYELTE